MADDNRVLILDVVNKIDLGLVNNNYPIYYVLA